MMQRIGNQNHVDRLITDRNRGSVHYKIEPFVKDYVSQYDFLFKIKWRESGTRSNLYDNFFISDEFLHPTVSSVK